MVGLRHDPLTGLYRWLCECGAGTGVRNSEDFSKVQWTDYFTANTGRIGHAMEHRR